VRAAKWPESSESEGSVRPILFCDSIFTKRIKSQFFIAFVILKAAHSVSFWYAFLP
jgi:hypothetical protein